MKNDYLVCGDTTIIYLMKRDGTVLETVIDTVDLDKASSIVGRWYANLDSTSGKYYVKSGIKRDGRVQKIPLHRFLFDEPIGMSIDHQNHDTLNNTRGNLRVLTIQDNQQNREDKRGTRGVIWHSRDLIWEVNVTVRGKKHYMGRFEDQEEAIRVAKAARKELMEYSTN